MTGPMHSETPPIDWPVVQVGDQRLIVRWTFYVQWLLSKRKVNLKDLPALVSARDTALVDVMVECFAAAVAENFTARNLPVPDAEYWALTISQCGDPGKWQEITNAVWAAVGKAPPAVATPAPQQTAPQAGMTQ